MTCIVGVTKGNKTYLGADRGYSDENIIVPGPSKLYTDNGWVCGWAGNVNGQLIRHLEFPNEVDEDALNLTLIPALQAIYEGVSIKDGDFLLGKGGSLFEINTDEWYVLRLDHAAIGSGAAFAYGSLFTTPRRNPRERVRLAVEAAVQYSPTCLAPVDIIGV